MARNLSRAMSQLRGLSCRLNLPEVVTERAALMYRRALNKGLVRGRPINGMVAASTYAACRLTDVPRSLSEIAKASGMSRKLLAHYYLRESVWFMVSVFDIEINRAEIDL